MGRYLIYRSGNWNNGSYDGAFTFYVGSGASISGSAVGLRLAKEGTVTDELAVYDE